MTRWLDEHVAGAEAPFRSTSIAGGHSNLTYRVTGADGAAFVLRRPPLGHVLASAHDMGREHRIIAGLQHSGVPVPPALGLCDDPSVNGAPFYVMGFVDGHVDPRRRRRRRARASRPGPRPAARSPTRWRRSTPSTSSAPACADLARHDGYIARQLKRWYGQWQQQQTRDLPAVDEVHDALGARIPDQGPATIVHGDYRLDNTMVVRRRSRSSPCSTGRSARSATRSPTSACCASTGPVRTTSPARGPGSRRRHRGSGTAARSSSATPRRRAATSAHLDFYVAFGYWKLACILEGVYARYVGGALGERDAAELEPFRQQVDRAAVMAVETLARLP